ncbi:hypothetical protein GCM10027596_00420 [Nocardioides korecus]
MTPQAGQAGHAGGPPIDREHLAALVGHELRTPLTMMVGYTELLSCGDAGELTSEQQRMVVAVERGVERVQELVEDLLAVATRAIGTCGCTDDVADAVRRLAGVDGEHEPARSGRSARGVRIPA